MGTIVTLFALAGLVAGPGARSTAALPDPDPAVRLVIDAGLLARLQVLAAGLHHEIVLCLTGSIDGATARATNFEMPDPRVSQAYRAEFGPCRAGSLAMWHNHPLVDPISPSRGDPGVRPRDLCALSDTDIQNATSDGPPFIMIGVDADTWCWWSRDQVRRLAAGNALHGAAVAGQVVARGATDALPSRQQ